MLAGRSASLDGELALTLHRGLSTARHAVAHGTAHLAAERPEH